MSSLSDSCAELNPVSTTHVTTNDNRTYPNPAMNDEIVTSSYTFRISQSKSNTKSSNNKINLTTVSGVNGVAVHQFADGSLLPSYNDIGMFCVVPDYDNSCIDKCNADTDYFFR